MENTGYVALSYAVGLERKMDLVANNIANADTSGYRSSHMIFREHVIENAKQKPFSMVEDVGNYRNFTPGPLQQTGNPLDVALEGNGFLAVGTPQGERYTRAGSMRMNNLGQLITPSGDRVLDRSGQPITVPAGSGDLSISRDGTIETNTGIIGRLRVVRFPDPQQLTPVGNNLYDSTQGGIIDDATIVTQGAIEGSNVNAVMEMTNMIEVMRKYQSVARLLQTEHDSQLSMIQKLGRA